MRYGVWFSPRAIEQLAHLDSKVLHRVVNRVERLSRAMDDVTHEALAGSLAGSFKLRVGDYRAVYDFVESERLLRIHRVGHRSTVYEPGFDD